MTIKAILLVVNLAGGQPTEIPYESMDLCREADEAIREKFMLTVSICIPADNGSVARRPS